MEREGHAGPSGDEDGCLFSLLDGGEGGGGRGRLSETSIRKNGICFVLKTSKNKMNSEMLPCLSIYTNILIQACTLSLFLFSTLQEQQS